MKHDILALCIALILPSASWACTLNAIAVKDPGACAVPGSAYVGAHRAKTHGGYCVIPSNCQLVTTSTKASTGCGSTMAYVGPHNSDEHGGFCVGVIKDGNLMPVRAKDTRNKDKCSTDEIYLGPHKATEHGGFCVGKNY